MHDMKTLLTFRSLALITHFVAMGAFLHSRQMVTMRLPKLAQTSTTVPASREATAWTSASNLAMTWFVAPDAKGSRRIAMRWTCSRSVC
jgi:hypothetical protein